MWARNPVKLLSTKMAFLWAAFSIVGGWLTFVDAPSVVHLGKAMMMMSAGYLLFGFGIKRQFSATTVDGMSEVDDPSVNLINHSTGGNPINRAE